MTDPIAHVRARMPELEPHTATRLNGGLLNHAWRVEGHGSVVVKHAPPHVASSPDIPLSPERVRFEAQALRWLADSSVPRPEARGPKLLDLHGDTLILEDLGDLPTLAERPSPEAAANLGHLVARLHTASPPALHNRAVQVTRDERIYQRYAPDLGQRLRMPGACLTMGDLWPASVLVDGWGVRLIDWELAHVGQPMQDTAHLAAHLWLLDALDAWQAFDRAYRSGLDPRALQPDYDACFARHFGVEVLVRALGPFVTEVRPDAEDVGRGALSGRLPAGVVQG